MKSLKSTDLRAKTTEELQTLVLEERAALYKIRRDLVFRQVTDTASLSVRRHNIARMLTIITEKEAKA
jgi:large subunit ribosomal protein L29